ncbi:hypothetical protein [Sediminibacterium goheungense]|uniref:WG repeat protein n=1 Tax=Sediminibacterium goheungense TaxID=1086393 RepID=A0A4R6J111_9BACT|nr:hypothetical protein [Sediminibacterium goheungense]TDO28912.1 hypothetical protein BC659_0994 [Sediminibacterium goheungense]
MKYSALFIALSMFVTITYCQTPNMAVSRVEMDRFMVDANGRLLKPDGDYNEEGTPYFSRNFLPGTVTILKGNTYHGLQVRINFHTHEIIFLDPDGREMVVAQPVERVELTTPEGKKIFRSGYAPIDKQDPNVFYEVLDSGAVSLLKYTEVSFSERQPYPNARYVRTYRDKVFYYMAKGIQLEKLPKNTDELPAMFTGKEAKLTELIKRDKLKLKKESDMIQLFRYANTL